MRIDLHACRKVHHSFDIVQRYLNKQLELLEHAHLLRLAKQWRLIGMHFVVHCGNCHVAVIVIHSSDVVVVGVGVE